MGRAFEYRKDRKMKRWSGMAKAFTRIGREIAIAVKEGGGDPNYNARLRMAIQNAKTANMPKANVENAIKKATSKDAEDYDEVLYEGYAPHGIALMLSAAFDERYFCYFEDVDLGFRLRLAGWRVLQSPDAIVAHVGGGSGGARSAFAEFHGARNRLWTFFKCMPSPLLW